MTGKERLEEIETKYSTLTVSSEKNGTEYTEVDVEDLVFLIQNGFKQAERVEELEDKCNYLSDMNEMLVDLNGVLPDEPELYIKLKKENKRYREAIEVAIHNMAASDNLGVKFVLGILEQALESEENESHFPKRAEVSE